MLIHALPLPCRRRSSLFRLAVVHPHHVVSFSLSFSRTYTSRLPPSRLRVLRARRPPLPPPIPHAHVHTHVGAAWFTRMVWHVRGTRDYCLFLRVAASRTAVNIFHPDSLRPLLFIIGVISLSLSPLPFSCHSSTVICVICRLNCRVLLT